MNQNDDCLYLKHKEGKQSDILLHTWKPKVPISNRGVVVVVEGRHGNKTLQWRLLASPQ
jgi:hypothetical protein